MHLLIVGELEGYSSDAMKVAHERGANVTLAKFPNDALKVLRSGCSADLIMIDADLGIEEFIKDLKAERFSIPVVACGVRLDAERAVISIRAGAKEYIPLPPDSALIGAVIEAICAETSAFLFEDPLMKSVLSLADQVAPSDAGILITGESGTGKEVMARYIHDKSRRASKKLVSVNCAAIPDNLLESELFGHEKGSFTGAVARRIGKFEEAHGSSLLLDEVTEMHPRLQAKLLRAIQEKEIDRVGGTQPVKVDIRLIATTNRNLQEAVQKGEFREDLYFRLNVVNLSLPPLRDRPKDILHLAKHFIQKYAKANNVKPKALSKEAESFLLSHSWPGNVRELENAMHRAVLLSSETAEITPQAMILTQSIRERETSQAFLSANPGQPVVVPLSNAPAGSFVKRTVAEVEKGLIRETLEHCYGNRTQAAHILGISIRTLRNKLKQYSEEGESLESGVPHRDVG